MEWTSKGGRLYTNNHIFNLKGVSWFGFETSNNVFHGLWAQDYRFFLDFIGNNSFNAIRVPFYLELMLNDATPNSINFYQMNQDLQGLSSLQVLDKIIEAAASRGLLIMLDMHSFKAGTFMQDGLWYDSSHPESVVLSTWEKVVSRYANQWNVFAFDLKNEPWATTWNTGDLTKDWDQAAARIGNHIHSLPGGDRFLIFVEGDNNSPACADACFWGENLIGVHNAPVKLNKMEKLVYSPHCYGPAVASQKYFNDPTFPYNMPAIWDTHYGFVPKETGNAIVIGEWGGPVEGQNGVWMNAFVDYLISKNTTDTFYWCLNPDSGDTGGILGYDWKTPDPAKLALLKKLVPVPTIILPN
uniref:Glycoside hydrolase family 5 domain-containing protein n=1 Tax=Arcella intermedia TaxID=1963864 RepID=A0A6B2L8B1_9EUKA